MPPRVRHRRGSGQPGVELGQQLISPRDQRVFVLGGRAPELLPPVDQLAPGRLELARWITSRENPLTARVMANRVWRHLFGTGLVRTVDNFGFSGERPSHPELLDDLAVRFQKDGWNVKALIKEMLMTKA
ncbi:MAG: DUF1553 domain-containing protein, partial [Myxococcota bacterium]